MSTAPEPDTLTLRLDTTTSDPDYKKQASHEIAMRLNDVRILREALVTQGDVTGLDKNVADKILSLDPSAVGVEIIEQADGHILVRLT